ncbi:molecular chaperone TorD family protein [Thiohalophilus sp.]|uniref:TorD/DmsD family molecular chaperone n=1 Tax=Thiohalophilus sp. TaxID=3028392 RepID=UPI002ACD3FDA|nr:molecular chaperone TorD family protein [Thiohalophilus sp.]MDZ7663335.1 molecular chaperone TorD family protein [Thiohalophilus sp.]
MSITHAEFWLCLARAFLPPTDRAFQTALREELVDDLAALAGELDYPLDEELAALRHSLAGVDGPELLVSYSRLFLVPGEEHPNINAGVYIDGTLHGDTVRRLTERYRAFGLARDEAFADLPDHVAVQLEFVARLYAGDGDGDAPGFLADFVQRWAPLLHEDLRQAESRFELAANPWLALAQVIDKVVALEAPAPQPAPVEEEDEILRLRRQYAGRSPDAADLETIRAALEAQGLDTAHLAVPVAERDAQEGLARLQVPEVPQHKIRSGGARR